MELKQQNIQLAAADKYPCPKCQMSGELTADYSRNTDLVTYFCAVCRETSHFTELIGIRL